MKYKEKTECRVCGSKDLKTILDLNDQPLANSYHDGSTELDQYPLKLNLCKKCYHSQLSVVVDPDEMFKHYLYVSGTTETLRTYFQHFYSDIVLPRLNGANSGNVLDIACNDGSQLEVFKGKGGWNTYGIDPAENLYERSSEKGFTKIVCDYFNEDSASKLGTKMDVIIAQNVFAHTDDIHSFLQACKSISHNNTKIFIQTSQANMFANSEFDTIYHEHLSFFCANSMNVCAQLNDMSLEDVVKTDIHGTSYVFVLSPKKGVVYEKAEAFLREEEQEGKTSEEFYHSFARKSKQIVYKLEEAIDEYREAGYGIVGYGAAAKAMTLLNFGKIDLDFIIDDNPLKQGLLTPGMNIPIHPIDFLTPRSQSKKTNIKHLPNYPLVFIPLAWNFYDEIKGKTMKVRGRSPDIYIRYFPDLIKQEIRGIVGGKEVGLGTNLVFKVIE